MIKSKEDARRIIEALTDSEMIKLYPNGKYGNLQVCITNKGCREFYNGEIGYVGEDPIEKIVDCLFNYRKAYNDNAKLVNLQ